MTIQEKIDKIKELAKKYHYIVLPETEEEVSRAEEELELKFPESFREFLIQIGYVSCYGPEWEHFRLGTKELREAFTDLSPDLNVYPDEILFAYNLVAFLGDATGNYYCIVCDGKDIGKVIFWDHEYAMSKETYPHVPEGEPDDYWIRGNDILDWMLEELPKEYKEQMERMQKPMFS